LGGGFAMQEGWVVEKRLIVGKAKGEKQKCLAMNRRANLQSPSDWLLMVYLPFIKPGDFISGFCFGGLALLYN
jgi:hypothetical protein